MTFGIETAAAQLDHSSPRITRRHYAETPRLGPAARAALDGFAIESDESGTSTAKPSSRTNRL